MKDIKKIITSLFLITVCFAVTGCGITKELNNAYKKMTIGESDNKINGYTMSIKLFGSYNDQRISTSVRVNNYMGKDFKAVIDNTTYYLIDDVKYKIIPNTINNLPSKELEDFDSTINASYEEIKESIPFTNTDLYISTLKTAKADDKPLTEKIGEIEYKTYTYLANKKIVSEMLKNTDLKDAEIKENVPTKVWIDTDGYIYKIEYDLSNKIEKSSNLTLTIYCSGINKAREISMDLSTPISMD